MEKQNRAVRLKRKKEETTRIRTFVGRSSYHQNANFSSQEFRQTRRTHWIRGSRGSGRKRRRRRRLAREQELRLPDKRPRRKKELVLSLVDRGNILRTSQLFHFLSGQVQSAKFCSLKTLYLPLSHQLSQNLVILSRVVSTVGGATEVGGGEGEEGEGRTGKQGTGIVSSHIHCVCESFF